MSNIVEQTSPGMIEDKEKDLRDKLLVWVRESEGSIPEVNWRTESKEDYAFYSGKQDTREVLAKLEKQKRPNSVYNKIMPKINMLIGLAAQSNRVPYIFPVTAEDDAMTEIMNGAFKHFRKKLRLKRIETECFEHTVKAGRSFLYFYMSGSNPFQPKIKAKRIAGRDVLIDPLSIEYDLSDARYVHIDKWFFADDLKALYPELDLDEIRQLSTSKNDIPQYYDAVTDKYRLTETWYRTWEKITWFKNPLTGQVESATPEEFKKFTAALAQGIPTADGQAKQIDPKTIQSVVRMKKSVRYAIFSNNKIIEEGPSPYKFTVNDEQCFPIVLFGAYKDEDENRWFSAITMMKDPQRMQNTVKRQLVHLLNTSQKNILVHAVGALLNPEEYAEKSSEPNFRLEINPQYWDKWKFTDQPQIPQTYSQLDQVADKDMKDVSGIQDGMLGIQTATREPGVTAKMRQDTNVAVLYILFDNFRESRIQAGKILLGLIQQFCPDNEMIRILGSEGEQLIQVNAQLNPQAPKINDLSAGEYDLEIDEAVDNVTMRMSIAGMLSDFAQNNPGSIPPDLIMEYMDVPWTARQKVKQFNEQQRAMQQQQFEQQMELEKMKIAGKSEDVKTKGRVDLAKAEMAKNNKSKVRGGTNNGS